MVTRVLVSKPLVRQDILTKGMIEKSGGRVSKSLPEHVPSDLLPDAGYTIKSPKGFPKERHQLGTKFAATHKLMVGIFYSKHNRREATIGSQYFLGDHTLELCYLSPLARVWPTEGVDLQQRLKLESWS